MADLLREVEQDMSDEKFTRLFTQHGKKLILAGVIIMAITIASYISKNISDKKALEAGNLFLGAFDDSDPVKYDAVIAKDQKAYSPMAALLKAGLLNSKDKNQDSVKTLKEISNNNSYDRAFREIAQINLAHLMIKNKADSKEIMAILDEVSGNQSVFRPLALELKAAYLLENGDKKQATEIFRMLADDKTIAETARERAQNVLSTIE